MRAVVHLGDGWPVLLLDEATAGQEAAEVPDVYVEILLRARGLAAQAERIVARLIVAQMNAPEAARSRARRVIERG